MKIQSITIVNEGSHRPSVVARLELGNLSGKESRAVKNFNKKLLELLPRLGEHYCDARQMGGFVERLHDGTNFNHVVEHIAVELLAQIGFDLRSKKVCGANEADESEAVIETTAVETTRRIVPLAADIVRSIVEEKFFSLEEKILESKHLAADYRFAQRERAAA